MGSYVARTPLCTNLYSDRQMVIELDSPPV